MAAEKQRLGAERWLIYGDIDKELTKLNKALATSDPPGPNAREVKVRRANLAGLIERARSVHIRYLATMKMDITTVDPETEFWVKLNAFEENIPWEEENFDASPVRADPHKAEREMEEYELYLQMHALTALVDGVKASKDGLGQNQGRLSNYVAECERGQLAATTTVL